MIFSVLWIQLQMCLTLLDMSILMVWFIALWHDVLSPSQVARHYDSYVSCENEMTKRATVIPKGLPLLGWCIPILHISPLHISHIAHLQGKKGSLFPKMSLERLIFPSFILMIFSFLFSNDLNFGESVLVCVRNWKLNRPVIFHLKRFLFRVLHAWMFFRVVEGWVELSWLDLKHIAPVSTHPNSVLSPLTLFSSRPFFLQVNSGKLTTFWKKNTWEEVCPEGDSTEYWFLVRNENSSSSLSGKEQHTP